MKAWWRRVRPHVLNAPIYGLVRLIGFTLRIRQEGPGLPSSAPPDPGTPGRIYAGWHGLTFIAAIAYRNQGFWTIISTSRDGEMQNRIFTRLGFRTIRGSTGRGGVRAAVESIRILRKGERMAFTPDGPRGPTEVVQPGIVMMAQKSGALIVPVGVAASRAWNAPTWDRYLIPKPFSRCLMLYGEPLAVPSDASEADLEAARLRLEQAIKDTQADAERRVRGDVLH